MKEETWFKMLLFSMALHFVVLGAFSIPIKKSSKRFETLSGYSVNLVGDMGGSGGYKAGDLAAKKPTPMKIAPQKIRPVLIRKEKEVVSLSKKKAPPKKTPTKEELSRLDDRLREIKKRIDYFDVTKTGGASSSKTSSNSYGLPGTGESGSRVLDPGTQRYILGVWEKIKDSWGLPGMASFKKDLETVVTIRIRKDGRIVDINMEKRSGNRVYDESILRVLRSIDPLPPIPDSLNTDTMEIGFRFLPGELS